MLYNPRDTQTIIEDAKDIERYSSEKIKNDGQYHNGAIRQINDFILDFLLINRKIEKKEFEKDVNKLTLTVFFMLKTKERKIPPMLQEKIKHYLACHTDLFFGPKKQENFEDTLHGRLICFAHCFDELTDALGDEEIK